MPELLEHRPEVVGHLPHNAQLARILVSHVRKHLEFQLVFLPSGERRVREFGRDGNEAHAFSLELIEMLLESL